MVTGVPTGREERTEIAGPPGTTTQIAPLSIRSTLPRKKLDAPRKLAMKRETGR